ncbi:hypothetical protein VSR01_10690 [Actinacidiphila sp. DG2A-62]|uniref:hypothetical protein n=1 Tax=Actinacidiphila sp. DG2A-62 TaxID=3108821 RepID=UPI002DBE501E|nr:hypothetical protein [Actinacidiphila sp. DG2A-62]MEC3993985.1 hypothetical protein [Actinacidiphila sp. DG2A-62]
MTNPADRHRVLRTALTAAIRLTGIVSRGHTALRARPGNPASRPLITWCGASMPDAGGEPIGPCILRADHDGPVHQAAMPVKEG